MKRFLKWSAIGAVSLVAVVLLFLIGGYAYAQFNGNWEYKNMIFFNSACSTATPSHAPLKGNAICVDTTNLSISVWNGTTAFALPTNQNVLVIKSPVSMCTTSNSVGAACAEPTQTVVPGFADAGYAISCTCASVGTNVPAVASVAKSTNAVVVTIAALTAASASCAEVDCIAVHP